MLHGVYDSLGNYAFTDHAINVAKSSLTLRVLCVLPTMQSMYTQVIWKRLYTSYSLRDKGTLYQLKNVINRTNLKANPKDSANATHDFISLVTTCHILSASMQLMKMNELKDIPDSDLVDESTWMLPASERKAILSQINC